MYNIGVGKPRKFANRLLEQVINLTRKPQTWGFFVSVDNSVAIISYTVYSIIMKKTIYKLRGHDKRVYKQCSVCLLDLDADTKGTRFDFLCKGCEYIESYASKDFIKEIDGINWMI